MDTFFGHLASHFAPSAENIAIEALGFILARSPAARRAFTGVASVGGLPLPADLAFATQATAEDTARPDIEGYGPDLVRHIVVETKFWAGLTLNQPLTYASRLPQDRLGALVFIVPSARLTSLWSELTKRLKAGDYVVGQRREQEPELWQTSFGAGHSFVLASWRAVLFAIQREMQIANESDRLEDLRQLQGLCDRMDTEAFLPFRSEELTAADVPQRYVQLSQLAYDLGEALISLGVCDGNRLTVTSGLGFYGRYLRSQEVVFLSAFDAAAWHVHKLSPLWLRFDRYAPPLVLAALRRGTVALSDTPMVIDREKGVLVPLHIPPGEERPAIVHALVKQATSVLSAVANLAPAFLVERPSDEP